MRFHRLLPLLLVSSLGLLGGCQSATGRDWSASPAILEVETDRKTSPILALSDIHGGYDRLVALFAKHAIIAGIPSTPQMVRWNAGSATLVVLGDLFDKGPNGVAVIDFFMALEQSAAQAGGRVFVTLGNHEAEFLANPENQKAEASDGIATQLRQVGLSPTAVASGQEGRGAWLRRRPFAVRVDRWFFSHAGQTRGRSLSDLSAALRNAVDNRGYNDPEILGANSILEAEDWADADSGIGARYAAALRVDHLVYGHNPSDLGGKGEIGKAQNGVLLRIDCGMSPAIDHSAGVLLRVELQGTQERSLSLEADGRIRSL